MARDSEYTAANIQIALSPVIKILRVLPIFVFQ